MMYRLIYINFFFIISLRNIYKDWKWQKIYGNDIWAFRFIILQTHLEFEEYTANDLGWECGSSFKTRDSH